MGEGAWESLAIQIPVVLVFCLFMGFIVKLFLKHISDQEERYRNFVKEQREANNDAVKDLASTQQTALERLADTMAAQLRCITEQMRELSHDAVSHDAFVRTAFKERFGMATMTSAEQAGEEARRAAERKTQQG